MQAVSVFGARDLAHRQTLDPDAAGVLSIFQATAGMKRAPWPNVDQDWSFGEDTAITYRQHLFARLSASIRSVVTWATAHASKGEASHFSSWVLGELTMQHSTPTISTSRTIVSMSSSRPNLTTSQPRTGNARPAAAPPTRRTAAQAQEIIELTSDSGSATEHSDSDIEVVPAAAARAAARGGGGG